VPQGANYQVNDVQGFLTLEAWYEQDLQGGTSGGGTGTALDWGTARQVKDTYAAGDENYDKASIKCDSNEVLVQADCHKHFTSSGTDVLCDTRTKRKAEIVDGDTTGESVWGTCVDKQAGTEGTDGDGGSLSGSPVFESTSYIKMGETSEFVTPRYQPVTENQPTLSPGDNVSVSRTTQLGGTTRFTILGGIVHPDREFDNAAPVLQRDFGYVQLLVDGEVVSEVQDLNTWKEYANLDQLYESVITTIERRRKPVMTTDPIRVETGDTVTARVVADQEVSADQVGDEFDGGFYQYVVLKRPNK
jgi:hypothetical protein